MKPMTKKELKDLREYLEYGDPLKDRYDEVELILRLVATVGELEPRDEFLTALEAAGVDNWDGYEEARELQRQWAEEGNADA